MGSTPAGKKILTGHPEATSQDTKLKFVLDKLEIAAGDLKTLFDLLDDTGDGEISAAWLALVDAPAKVAPTTTYAVLYAPAQCPGPLSGSQPGWKA